MTALASAQHRTHVSLAGTLMCLVSAASFGAMAVFGKLAFDAGITVITLLAVRFALSAAVLAPFTARRWRTIPRRRLLQALALGGVADSGPAGAYFLWRPRGGARRG